MVWSSRNLLVFLWSTRYFQRICIINIFFQYFKKCWKEILQGGPFSINNYIYKYTNMVQNINYYLAWLWLKITIQTFRALSKQTSSREIYKANKKEYVSPVVFIWKNYLFSGSTYHLANIHNRKEYCFFERSSSKTENFQTVFT